MKSFTLAVLTAASLGFVALGAAPALADLKHWSGKQRALVLLVEWRNQPARHSRDEVNGVFFGQNKMSLKEFFDENSAGTFELSGAVREWKHSDQDWDSNAGCNLDSIVSEAWKLYKDEINVADYDSDQDGRIDNLFIVHSGRIASDRVGPDCAFTESSYANHTVVFQSEGIGNIGNSIPIGFYLHEAGHGYFGFPDLYRDHYHGRYGIGMWGMMGLGAWGTNTRIEREDLFRVPAHFEPYSKVQIGWSKPRVIATSTHVTLRPVENSADIVQVPNADGSSFYLEYRSERGFSKDLAGHGLLIWKDYELIQADGRDDLNHGRDVGHRPLPPINENFGDDSDPFPGSGQVTSYEDRSARVRFENITQFEDRIELDIRF